MFKSFANIFSSLGSIFKRSGKSSSASSTGVGGTNEKKSFIGKLIASLSTKIIDSLSKYWPVRNSTVAAHANRKRRMDC